MTTKISSCVNSVRFRNVERYRFFQYTFELPAGYRLIQIHLDGNRYIAQTSQGKLTLRACPRCNKLLQLTQFYKACSSCKTCHQVLTKDWSKRHPERAKEYAKKGSKKYRYKKKLESAGVE